jgi:hypothetical protein
MAKVTFLKDHLHHKAGDEHEVEDARANYWELTGVAEKKVVKESKEKKDIQPSKKKVIKKPGS